VPPGTLILILILEQRTYRQVPRQVQLPSYQAHQWALAPHHATNPICLVVNTFGRQHAEHSMNALADLYQITSDWFGTKYCGLTIDWDCKARTIDISMPGYVESVIHKLQYESQIRHAWIKPRTTPHDDSLPLDKTIITRLK
jgi:hypothetical protein